MANFLDQNGVLYLWSKIKSAFVAKEDGKQLSTNDFTTDEKNKLAAIDEDANKYTLPTASAETLGGIKIGAGLTIDSNGVLNSTFGGTADSVEWTGVLNTPTTLAGYGITDAPSKTSDLDNDSNFVSDASYVHTDNNYTTTEKIKLNGIAAGADVSPITSIKVNGVVQSISGKAVNVTVPTKVSDLTNDSGYLTAHQDISGKADKATSLAGYGISDAYTKSEVDAKITSTYKAGGNKTFATLPTLSSANVGYVYNVTDSFTTTDSYVEGAGKTYPIGTNVAIVEVSSGTYKYDVMAGFIDLSPYVKSTDITAISNSQIDAIVAS